MVSWRTASGSVFVQDAADFVSNSCLQGLFLTDASEVPRQVRERLDALYVEAIGRSATDTELTELLGFAGG